MTHLYNGSTWDRARGDTANGVDVDVTRIADQTGSGSLTATSQSASIATLNGAGSTSVQITGTWVGTVQFEGTVDGSNWFGVNAVPIPSGAFAASATANGQWQIDTGGLSGVRVRCSAYTSGTIVVTIRASIGAALVGLDMPLPTGSNIIGALSANQSTNIAQMNGVAVTMGAGASGTGVQRVAIATDGQGQIVDNAAFTDGTTRLDMAGYILDETAGTALTENDAAAARIDSKRAQVQVIEDATTRGQRASVNTSGGLAVTPTPHTAGGLTISRVISAASTNATSAKASVGQVFTIIAMNTNAAVRYLKLYNKASAPTVGTDTPVMTIPIPGNTAGAGFVLDTGGMGIAFATGIALALTTGIADSDTGAVAANEIVVNILYK